MKNGKTDRPTGLLSDLVKSECKTGINIITDLINQIIEAGVISAKYQLAKAQHTAANCYKRKENALERKREKRGETIGDRY